MSESIRSLLMWLNKIGFAKPDFDLGSESKIHEADQLSIELEQKQKELERRLRLLHIKGSPRSFDG